MAGNTEIETMAIKLGNKSYLIAFLKIRDCSKIMIPSSQNPVLNRNN